MADKSEKKAPEKPLTDGWRDMVAQWEKGLNSLANTTMASDEFSSTANGSMALALRAQQVMGSAMATYLATLNLPSRADVTAIADRLQAIETTMERIARSLEMQQPQVANGVPKRFRAPKKPPRPRRTKRPPGEALPK